MTHFVINEPIQVEINVAGHKTCNTYYPYGYGAYPYTCGTQDKYPNAMVYKSDGAWLILDSGEYEKGDDGIYRSKWGLI